MTDDPLTDERKQELRELGKQARSWEQQYSGRMLIGHGIDVLRDCVGAVGTAIPALLAENARLRAVVDKLPKTADGVPVVPGMTICWWCKGTLLSRVLDAYHTSHNVIYPQGKPRRECVSARLPSYIQNVPLELCYSTHEAAEAATENDHD